MAETSYSATKRSLGWDRQLRESVLMCLVYNIRQYVTR